MTDQIREFKVISDNSESYKQAIQEAIVKSESYFWDYVLRTEGTTPKERKFRKHSQKFKTTNGMAYTWRGKVVCGFQWDPETGILNLLQLPDELHQFSKALDGQEDFGEVEDEH